MQYQQENFFREKKILGIDEHKYEICSQWDVKNIKWFLDIVSELGVKITEFKMKMKEICYEYRKSTKSNT